MRWRPNDPSRASWSGILVGRMVYHDLRQQELGHDRMEASPSGCASATVLVVHCDICGGEEGFAVTHTAYLSTTDAHPTMNLRHLDRATDHHAVRQQVLQQEWAIITLDGMNRPIDRKTEWRDVPVVTG